MYYLLDKQLNILCPIEAYQSMIWTTRYYEAGDFELYVPATQQMLDTIRTDYFIVRDDDFTQAMIIQNITVLTDIEQGNYMTITGKSLKNILSRRIIWHQTTVNGKVETCIRRLVDDNAVNPHEPLRKISRLVLGPEIGLTETIKAQFTGDNLETAIQDICKNYKIGYDILLDLENKQFIFILYKGSDRSYNQSQNPHIIFSNDFENLLRTNYASGLENYKNAVLIAGEGEGINRRTATIGATEDLDRYEAFVDARDVSSNDGELSEGEYIYALVEKGYEFLSNNNKTESIDGEVETEHTYKVNQDYFLGDIVEVINEYGIIMTPRIVEIIESDDETGHYTIPTFKSDD